ncbi:flagellar hook-associated protein FlgK [Fodinibius sediminis]|uniref:Flagellar hook-associated protein 1 n=1 Tax=Fodinibius sediminis TaxID=1214077 RepID=A0A521CGY4_9BACT|nr:flagellar hook-associated protein FlgK [Fodinibius sediminis]SMO58737.1 flagellar hook-associated protein 1 FlgK [Fodinibius sediminis]
MRNIFEIARSGLLASQKSTAVVSHNIANANTPGYTRQRTDLSAATLQQDGFTVGRGVSIEAVEQLRKGLTDRQLMLKEHELGDMNERTRIYQQIESTMVTSGGSDLDVALDNFFNTFSELANNPQDINQRNVVISESRSLVATFKNLASDLGNIKSRVHDAALSRVENVNSILQSLTQVNADIARAEASGQPELNGKDQQMELIKKLSGLVDLDTTFNSDGTVEARIDGIVVLDGTDHQTITAETGPGSEAFRLRLDNGKLIEPGSGSLAADIDMYEEVLPETQQRLDDIAAAVVTEVNAIHSSGYGLEDNTNRSFFNPSYKTAGSITLNPELVESPEHIAASSAAGEAGNNDLALQMSDLRNKKILDGKTFNNNVIEMISRPGIELNKLQQSIKSKESAKQMLVNQQQSQAGVNIDEELSDLIKFQNAYQASARVLQTGQQMYDTLLGII